MLPLPPATPCQVDASFEALNGITKGTGDLLRSLKVQAPRFQQRESLRHKRFQQIQHLSGQDLRTVQGAAKVWILSGLCKKQVDDFLFCSSDAMALYRWLSDSPTVVGCSMILLPKCHRPEELGDQVHFHWAPWQWEICHFGTRSPSLYASCRQAQPAWQSIECPVSWQFASWDQFFGPVGPKICQASAKVQPSWSFPPAFGDEKGFGVEPSNVRSSEATYIETLTNYLRFQQQVAPKATYATCSSCGRPCGIGIGHRDA